MTMSFLLQPFHLKKFLTQQEQETHLLEASLDTLQKSNDFSFENMKNGIIYGSNLASFCVEKFGTERMEDLSKEAIQKRLQQFRQLTQFEIEIA